MQGLMLRQTLNPPGLLDAKLRDAVRRTEVERVTDAAADQGGFSRIARAFHAPNPLLGVLGLRVACVLLMAAGLSTGIWHGIIAIRLREVGVANYQFGLLERMYTGGRGQGCAGPRMGMVEREVDGWVIQAYDSPRQAVGWYVKGVEGAAEAPSCFTVQGSHDAVTWTRFGPPLLRSDGRGSGGGDDGEILRVDLRAQWHHYIAHSLSGVLSSIGVVAAACLGYAGMPWLARWALVAGTVAGAAAQAVGGFAVISLGQKPGGLPGGMAHGNLLFVGAAVQAAGIGGAAFYLPRWYGVALLVSGCLLLAVTASDAKHTDGLSWRWHAAELALIAGAGLSWCVTEQLTAFRVWRGIQRDREALDEAWRQVLRKDGEALRSLHAVANAVRKISIAQEDCPSPGRGMSARSGGQSGLGKQGPALQLNRMKKSKSPKGMVKKLAVVLDSIKQGSLRTFGRESREQSAAIGSPNFSSTRFSQMGSLSSEDDWPRQEPSSVPSRSCRNSTIVIAEDETLFGDMSPALNFHQSIMHPAMSQELPCLSPAANVSPNSIAFHMASSSNRFPRSPASSPGPRILRQEPRSPAPSPGRRIPSQEYCRPSWGDGRAGCPLSPSSSFCRDPEASPFRASSPARRGGFPHPAQASPATLGGGRNLSPIRMPLSATMSVPRMPGKSMSVDAGAKSPPKMARVDGQFSASMDRHVQASGCDVQASGCEETPSLIRRRWRAQAQVPEAKLGMQSLEGISKAEKNLIQALRLDDVSEISHASGDMGSDGPVSTEFEPKDDMENFGFGYFGPYGGEPFTRDLECRVRNLDQLYAQASLIEDIFWEKVVKLALATGGLFGLDARGTGRVVYVAPPSDITLVSNINDACEKGWKFPPLKQPLRCVEKVARVYGGDASRLCDVVRQTIVFDSLQGITACLRELQMDEEVLIVGIRNNLHAESDASGMHMPTGFRFVSLRVMIHSWLTGALCIEGHVCELLLVLSPFVKLTQSEETHQRYVMHRTVWDSVSKTAAVRCLRWLQRSRRPNDASLVEVVDLKTDLNAASSFSLGSAFGKLSTQEGAKSDMPEAAAHDGSGIIIRDFRSFSTSSTEGSRRATLVADKGMTCTAKPTSAMPCGPERETGVDSPNCFDLPEALKPPPLTSLSPETSVQPAACCSLQLEAATTVVSSPQVAGPSFAVPLNVSKPDAANARESETSTSDPQAPPPLSSSYTPEGVRSKHTMYKMESPICMFADGGFLHPSSSSLNSVEPGQGPSPDDLREGSMDDSSTSGSKRRAAMAKVRDQASAIWRIPDSSMQHHAATVAIAKEIKISNARPAFGCQQAAKAVGGAGVSLNSDLLDVVEYYARIATTGMGGFFGKTMRRASHVGMKTARASSALFTSRPMEAFFQKPRYWIVIVLLAVGLSIRAIFNWQAYTTYHSFRHFRLKTLSNRDSDGPAGAGAGLPFKGWFVKTLEEEGSAGRDAGAFVIEARRSDGEEWSEIAMPKWLSLTNTHDVAYYVGKRVSLPLDRGQVVLFQTTASPAWFVDSILRNFIYAFNLTLVFIIAAAGRGEYARRMCQFITVLDLAINVLAGVCFAIEGGWAGATGCFLWLPMRLGLVLAFFGETRSRVFLLLFMTGVADIAATCVQACLVDGEYTAHYMRDNVPAAACFLFSFLFLVLLSRRHALRMSRKLVEKDVEKYEIVWRQHMKADEQDGYFALLEEKVASLQRSCGICRQYERKRLCENLHVKPRQGAQTPDILLDYLELRTIPNTIDVSRPITSLDQLYACASVVNAMVLDKIKTWAFKSEGMFPVEPTKDNKKLEFRRWSEVRGTEDEDLIKWSCLKKYHRATEKVSRSYGDDMSRLLDVCRHGIIFETPKDLTRCLDEIMLDSDVKIERVKNRHSSAYNPSVTAGYRDVAINLRLVTPETIALGVETHLCEVQLILKGFANIRTLDGHKRYIAWRNWRGL